MRIFLNEIKKILSFRSVSTVIILCISALAIVLAFFLYDKGVFAIYGANTEVHWKDRGNGGEEVSRYKVYRWFTDNFGTEMNDETAEKLRKLEFPALEAEIQKNPLFAELGVYSLNDFSELLDSSVTFLSVTEPYGSEIYHYYLADEMTSEEGSRYVDKVFAALSALGRSSFADDVYVDYYISQSELCRSRGITSCLDYNNMFKYGERDSEVMDEYDRINKRIAEDIRSGRTIPELDELHDECCKYLFCYKLLNAYEMSRTDRTAYIRSVCRDDTWFEELNSEYLIKYDESNAEKIDAAAEALGDSWFTVRSRDIRRGFEATAWLLLSASACVSAVFAASYSAENRINRVNSLLYSAKKGFSLIYMQLLSVIAVSVVVTTVFSLALVLLTKQDLYADYYDLPMSSFASCELFPFDMNFRQYILFNIAVSYVVSAVFAVIAFILGMLCTSHISAFACEIPLCVAAVLVYLVPFKWLFILPESIFGDLLWLAGLAAAAGIAAALLLKKRNAAAILIR